MLSWSAVAPSGPGSLGPVPSHSRSQWLLRQVNPVGRASSRLLAAMIAAAHWPAFGEPEAQAGPLVALRQEMSDSRGQCHVGSGVLGGG